MAVPGSGRTDLPMIPMPVYPHQTTFIQATDNPHMNKVPVTVTRVMHTVAHPVATASVSMAAAGEPQVPQIIVYNTNPQVVAGNVQSNVQTAVDHQYNSTQSADGSAADGSHIKLWSTEQTVELIQLYRKYLPQFHTSGQRKMNVWQSVTQEMADKGFASFSWADCSNKFRSLRDSYRRMTTGSRAPTWPYYSLMKEVMKTEKMILEQEAPSLRQQKGTITCENELNSQTLASQFGNSGIPLLQNAGSLSQNSGSLSQSAGLSLGVQNADILVQNPAPDRLTNNVTVIHNALSYPSTSQGGVSVDEQEGDGGYSGSNNRKRVVAVTNGPSSKKSKDSLEQEEEMTIGRNFNGEQVKVKVRNTQGPMGSLQALGKNLCLPQTQLVVGDDGQVVQTTSSPTGLFINEAGHLCSSNNQQSSQGKQMISMPQWFKLYEKRTRAENNRRLEELKDMHQESLQLQRQALQVASQKNELLKSLVDSLAEFKALLHR